MMMTLREKFSDDSPQLVMLGTRDVMLMEIAISLGQCHKFGKVQHGEFVRDRIELSKVQLSNVIYCNNLLALITILPLLTRK